MYILYLPNIEKLDHNNHDIILLILFHMHKKQTLFWTLLSVLSNLIPEIFCSWFILLHDIFKSEILKSFSLITKLILLLLPEPIDCLSWTDFFEEKIEFFFLIFSAFLFKSFNECNFNIILVVSALITAPGIKLFVGCG